MVFDKGFGGAEIVDFLGRTIQSESHLVKGRERVDCGIVRV